MDYLELLDFVAYDVEAARKVIEELREAKKSERLEKVQSQPVREECWGLCCPCCSCGAGSDMGRILLVVMR